MDILLLQDLVTASSSVQTGLATQPASGWLDISAYEDVVLHIDLKDSTSVGVAQTLAVMNFQTAPAPEDASFVTMFNQVGSLNGAGVVLPVGVTSVQPLLIAYATVPPAKYVRWQLAALAELGVTTATFRILVTAFSLAC
jgi:hypothetical protein